MRAAGIDGAIVPWDDVLHEGPVPAGLNAAALRERRAEFLASCGWGTSTTRIRRDRPRADASARCGARPRAGRRDRALVRARSLRSAAAAADPRSAAGRRHAARDGRAGRRVPRHCSPRASFAGTVRARGATSTSAQRIAARDAWDAFRSTDPRAIVDVLPRVTVLPHLGAGAAAPPAAVPVRSRTALSRTEQQALEAIAGGRHARRATSSCVASRTRRSRSSWATRRFSST